MYSVWDGPNNGNTGIQNLALNSFGVTPLTVDGQTEYEVQAWIVGDTVTIDLPDGSRTAVTDSRIGNATYGGPYVFFEQFSNVANTDNRVGFTHLWATSGFSKPSDFQFTPWKKAQFATAAKTASITTAYTPVDVPGLSGIDFVAPPSGQVVVKVGAYFQVPSATDIYLGVAWATNGASGDVFNLIYVPAANGYVQTDMVITGLTFGTQYALTPQFNGPAGLEANINPADQQNALLTVEPVF